MLPPPGSLKARCLLIDRTGRSTAHGLVLRTSAARTAEGSDDPAALDQRNAAARADHIVECQQIIEPRFLHTVFKCMTRTSIAGGNAGFVLGNGDRGELGREQGSINHGCKNFKSQWQH